MERFWKAVSLAVISMMNLNRSLELTLSGRLGGVDSPGAGESTLDTLPLAIPAPLRPSMKLLAIFSDASSWAVIECLSRKCRNDGLCFYHQSQYWIERKWMKVGYALGIDSLELSQYPPISLLAPLREHMTAPLHPAEQIARLSAPDCALSLVSLRLVLIGGKEYENNSLAISSFSLPSRSTSDARS